MRQRNIEEAERVLKSVTELLLRTVRSGNTEAGAELRQACGDLVARGEELIREGGLGPLMSKAFSYAFAAGATPDAFALMRLSCSRLTATFAYGNNVLIAAKRFTLVNEVRALALAEFKSKSECDNYRDRLNVAFDEVIEEASENGEDEVIKAFTASHAAAVRDLVSRGRSLPQMIAYSFSERKPSLWVANRIYGDASRADEVAEENNARHPLFMPEKGQALTGVKRG